MALEIFKLVGSIFIDNEKANQSIHDTDKEAQGVGTTLLDGVGKAAKWGTAIVAGATAAATAVVGVSSKAVESYADYEQLVGGVETLFEDSADTVLGYAEEAYKTAGMTANQYMETVTGFSASLLQSAGRGAQQDLTALKANLEEELKATKYSLQDQYDARKKALEAEIKAVKEGWTDKSDAGKAALQKEVERLQAAKDEELKQLKRSNEEQLAVIKDGNAQKLAEAEEANQSSITTAESQARAAEIANQAIIDMSDNANKMGTDMAAIQNAYQGFAKQNYTMLDNLKLGYGGTKGEMERLLADAERLTGIKYDISNLTDVYEAIHVIQGEMGITGTTAKEATSTIQGSIGMLKAKLENFKNTIGASIAPVVQKFLNMAIDYLPTIEQMVGQIAPIISDLVQAALPVLVSVLNAVTAAMPGILKVITFLLQNIPALTILVGGFTAATVAAKIATMGASAAQVALALKTALTTKAQALLNSTFLANPIGIVIAAIAALVAAFVLLWNNCEDFRNFWINLWNKIKEIVSTCVKAIGNFFSNLGSTIKTWAGNVKSWFTSLGDGIKSILANVGGFFKSAWTTIKAVFFEPIQNYINTIKGVLEGLLQFISGVFTGNWKQAWQGAGKIFSSVFDGLKAAFRTPFNWIINGINKFINGLNKIKIPDWVPAVGGKGFNIATIPTLASGGVLEKGQTGFLEGNGAEAVVPLENNQKWIKAVAQDMDGAVGGASGDKILAKLADILSALEDITGLGITLDTGALVGGLAKPMDKKLGQLAAQKARA